MNHIKILRDKILNELSNSKNEKYIYNDIFTTVYSGSEREVILILTDKNVLHYLIFDKFARGFPVKYAKVNQIELVSKKEMILHIFNDGKFYYKRNKNTSRNGVVKMYNILIDTIKNETRGFYNG